MSVRTCVQPAGAVMEAVELKVIWASSTSPLATPAGLETSIVDPALLVALDVERNAIVAGEEPQPRNRNEPTRVCHGAGPVAGRYSFVYQNVQPSVGSTLIEL